MSLLYYIAISNYDLNLKQLFMKINTDSVRYVEEHKSCKHFMKEKDSLFDSVTFDHADVYKSRKVKLNALIFFIAGRFKLVVGNRKSISVNEASMFAVSELESFKIHGSDKSRVMILYFNSPVSACSKAVFYSYVNYVNPDEYKDIPLPINPPMRSFVELLNKYVSAGVSCAQLLELKKEELFLALRWFYSKEELRHLFYHVVKDSCAFRRFVLSNHMNFENVTEMIEASNMSKSAFYEKFKKTFSVSVKQWMLSRQKQQILNKAAEPDISAKDLMNEFNFSSPAHLTSFCKKQFGLTPSELIRTHQLG